MRLGDSVSDHGDHLNEMIGDALREEPAQNALCPTDNQPLDYIEQGTGDVWRCPECGYETPDMGDHPDAP